MSPPSQAYCTQQTGGLTRGMTLRAIHVTERDRARCWPPKSSGAAPTMTLRAIRHCTISHAWASHPNLRGERRLAFGGMTAVLPAAANGSMTRSSASNALSAIRVSDGMLGTLGGNSAPNTGPVRMPRDPSNTGLLLMVSHKSAPCLSERRNLWSSHRHALLFRVPPSKANRSAAATGVRLLARRQSARYRGRAGTAEARFAIA